MRELLEPIIQSDQAVDRRVRDMTFALMSLKLVGRATLPVSPGDLNDLVSTQPEGFPAGIDLIEGASFVVEDRRQVEKLNRNNNRTRLTGWIIEDDESYMAEMVVKSRPYSKRLLAALRGKRLLVAADAYRLTESNSDRTITG